ncbi:hypothetical protein JCM11641_003627 [Rhodosporidiobolus odoratus]
MPPKKSAAKKKKNLGAARGFATTSVPKKVVATEADEAVTQDDSTLASSGNEAGKGAAAGGGGEGKQGEGNGTGEQKKDGEGDKVGEDWDDPEAVEKRELQELAERIRPGCDKEVSRVVKVIDYERRMAKTMPGYAFSANDQDLQRRILDLALLEAKDETPQHTFESEDKVIAKVATLFGILEQLGFTETRIEECLRAVKVLDLDECMDWLFLHCDPSELNCEGPIAAPEPDVVESAPPTPRAGNSPRGSLAGTGIKPLTAPTSETPLSPGSGSSASAGARSRTTTGAGDVGALASGNGNGVGTAEEQQSLKARIMAYEEELDKQLQPLAHAASTPSSPSMSSKPSSASTTPAPSTSSSKFFSAPSSDSDSDSDSDTDLPDSNANYASLKLQLSEIQRAQAAHKRATKGKGDRKGGGGMSREEENWMEAKGEVLKGKIREVEGEYTFRKSDAEKLYREERTKLDAAQLAARLNGTKLDSVVPGFPSPTSNSTTTSPATNGNGLAPAAEITPSTSSAPSTPGLASNGASSSPSSPGTAKAHDDNADGFFGNLLDEPMSTTTASEEVTDSGTTIPIRDVALPKHFSGKTPKASLEETVRKIDKYGTVVFSVVSRSRAVRATVTVRWSGSLNVNGIPSEAPAASTGRTQTFLMTDVACSSQSEAYNYIATVALFNVVMSREGAGIQVHKALPTVFREFWDELLKGRREEEEGVYRGRLRGWRGIAEARRGGFGEGEEGKGRDLRTTNKSEKLTVAAADGFDAVGQEGRGRKETSPELAERLQNEIYQRQTWPTYQEMLRQRANLPIAAYRSMIMNTIEESQCVVLCGETGCGKSTQVPSFILEHDLRLGRDVKIFCTEPRRISAISLAQRVSQELGEPPNACGTRNSYVGYSIRLDSAVSANTRICYATTGIVLRMLEGKESLADVTHIIIDEVHERSIDSDFLLIVLREILEVRKDLKVILMSATVDAEKIAEYMGGCPVVRVPGRTFPVNAHYLEDVVELTRYKLDPHLDSPYIARNKRAYGAKRNRTDDVPLDEDEDEDDMASSGDLTSTPLSKQSRITLECMNHHMINYDLIVLLLENLCFHKPDLVPFSSAILIFLPSLESIRRLTDTLEAHAAFGSSQFLILPLHSTISNENQGMVFNVPRPGVRKIVISTNIAETGVTIPDITAVIDSGLHREMRFDEKRQISRLVETFVAQSNAKQRRGRAGRVREGVCFHLFTKHRQDNYMQEHPQPEMLRLSLQDLALRIKIMKIGPQKGIEETLTSALDAPTSINIQRAVSALVEVGALTSSEEITPLGRHLAKLPMDVHLGLFLIMSCIFNCLDAALTITAALNSKSPWVTPFGRESEADAVKRGFKIESSDFLTTYNAYCHWRDACSNNYEMQFVRKSFLSLQNLQQIEELRQQFFSFLVDAGFVRITDSERRSLTNVRYGKSRTKFTRVPSELDTSSKDPRAVMACLAASMYPKLLVIDPQNGSLRTLANSAPAAIHPSSVNFSPGRKVDFGTNARFATFFTAMHTKKLYMWESGGVDERAVFTLCGNADFQLAAHSLSIDRKVRTHFYDPKTLFALKSLRTKWRDLFNRKMKDPAAPLDPRLEPWLGLVREALASPFNKSEEEEKKKKERKKEVKLSLTRNG